MSWFQVCGFIATMRSTPPRRPRWPFSVTRTSYHVGRPWMFDGKMLRGETGMPMRRKLFAKSSFADAEPEPLTLANLTTKSLTATMRAVVSVFVGGIFFVDDTLQGCKLELAHRGLVRQEFLAHRVGGHADFGRRQPQLRGLRGELDLARAVQAPEAD